MNPVMQLIQSHRSIRKFTDEPVDDKVITEIVRCGQAAATSSNLQATTVVRVRKAETRRKIAQVAGNQEYVSTAAEAALLVQASVSERKAFGFT